MLTIITVKLSNGHKRDFKRDDIVLIVDPGAIPGKPLYLIKDGLRGYSIDRAEYCRIERQIRRQGVRL